MVKVHLGVAADELYSDSQGLHRGCWRIPRGMRLLLFVSVMSPAVGDIGAAVVLNIYYELVNTFDGFLVLGLPVEVVFPSIV